MIRWYTAARGEKYHMYAKRYNLEARFCTPTIFEVGVQNVSGNKLFVHHVHQKNVVVYKVVYKEFGLTNTPRYHLYTMYTKKQGKTFKMKNVLIRL